MNQNMEFKNPDDTQPIEKKPVKKTGYETQEIKMPVGVLAESYVRELEKQKKGFVDVDVEFPEHEEKEPSMEDIEEEIKDYLEELKKNKELNIIIEKKGDRIKKLIRKYKIHNAALTIQEEEKKLTKKEIEKKLMFFDELVLQIDQDKRELAQLDKERQRTIDLIKKQNNQDIPEDLKINDPVFPEEIIN